MRLKVAEKKKAVSLREKGYSYNEICEMLGLAKSTCSVWLRDVKLNKKAIQRLVDRQDEGQRRAALTLRQYRDQRDAYLRQKANRAFKNVDFTSDVGKLLCAMLYWAEGSKDAGELRFTNSDPNMITVYMKLLRNYFQVDERKFRALLHLHSYHSVKKQKLYWSKITKLPLESIQIYRKPNSGKNIRPGYPGCISIRYYDVRLAIEMKFLYTAVIEKLRGVV